MARRIPAAASVLAPLPSIPPFIGTALVAPRAGLTGREAVRQMADDFRQAAYREGGITRDGLALLGWKASQIDTLAGEARELAQRDAVVGL